MNHSTTENNWNNKWNQSIDIVLAETEMSDGTKYCEGWDLILTNGSW